MFEETQPMAFEPAEQTELVAILEQIFAQLEAKQIGLDAQLLQTILEKFKNARELTVNSTGEVLKALNLKAEQIKELMALFQAALDTMARQSAGEPQVI